MSPVFVRRVRLSVDAGTALAWHERPGALQRLRPPWRNSRDRQFAGPFTRFAHTHSFEPAGDGCVMEDRVAYEPLRSPFGRLAAHWIHRELARQFAWRHRVLRVDLERARARGHRPLAIAISGASGMLGRELVPYLTTQGCTVRRLVRHAARTADEIPWDPARGTLDPAALAGVDAVIHLAGAGIADARWTRARRRELLESRIRGTGLLARALAELPRRPQVLVSASAIGWYGNRGDEPLDESSPGGQGFLAEVGRAWEGAAQPARDAGVRVVHPRVGIVLWPGGGALARLALATRWGAGGPLGNGRQWWSWVTLHDLLDMMMRAVDDPAITGPFNAVAPAPVRQRDLARSLGRALRRPAITPAPAFALRAVLGQGFANETLLTSHRVAPRVLGALGYAWRDPELDPALARLFGRADEDAEVAV